VGDLHATVRFERVGCITLSLYIIWENDKIYCVKYRIISKLVPSHDNIIVAHKCPHFKGVSNL